MQPATARPQSESRKSFQIISVLLVRQRLTVHGVASLQSCTVVVQLPLELHSSHNLSAAVTEVLKPHRGNVTFDGHVARIGA